MNRVGAVVLVAAVGSLLAGCASSGQSPLPVGPAAYETIPERASNDEGEVIQSGDRLAIRVFGEPDLSSEVSVVDASGYIQMPLLGEVIAAGQSPRSLSAELKRRLNARYIRNPDVTVMITDRPQATFTVEGDVTTPGVYPATSTSTLLSALAQAKSPTKTARTGDIIVLRRVNGQRTGGRFNLADIRRGRSPDPQILAGDTIVVTNSAGKSAWRDVLAALPLLNTFILLRQN